MTLVNGQLANQTTFNNAFMSKTSDTGTTGKVALNNAGSNSIVDTQAYINKIAATDGIIDENDTTDTTYSSNVYVTNGSDRKTAIGALDASLSGVATALQTHSADNANPHGVTAAQVGAYTTAQTDTAISTAINNLIDGAPATLDTLNELAAALADDANFASTVTTALAGKEPTITAGTASQYYRGDKTFQTLDAAAVGLGNVTNDAQLKRSANDYNLITEKTTLANDDLILIEDSADSFNKKKVKKSNLGGGSGSGVAPWVTAAAYVVDQVVSYNNKLWRCFQAHTSPATFESNYQNYWFLLSPTDNLMKIGDTFESGTPSGWQVGTISGYTAGTFPTSAMTGLTDATVSSGTPISDLYSLAWTAITAGSVITSPIINIDVPFRGRNLNFSFDYFMVNGLLTTNVSGTSASTFHVLLYDVTNAKWVQPINTYGINSASGTWNGTCQLDSTCTQVRYVVLVANTIAATPALRFDNFSITKKITPIGAVTTDWKDYPTTPTLIGFGTPTITEAKYRQVGSDIEIRGKFTSGTSTATTAQWPLPSGLSIADATKVSAIQAVGTMYTNANSSNITSTFSVLATPSTNYLNFGFSQSALAGSLTAQTGSILASSGNVLSFYAKVPIQGWSSNVIMSSDAGSTYVLTDITAGSQVLTANVTNIVFSTVNKDTTGSFSSTTFTVPSPGDYLVNLYGNFSANAGIDAFVNGVSKRRVLNSGAAGTFGGSGVLTNLKAGDLVTFRSVTSLTLNAMELTIQKNSSPQTIGLTDTIAARYTSTAGNSVGTSPTLMNFATKTYDKKGNYSAGVFTCGEPGLYEAGCFLTTASMTLSTIQNFEAYLYKNGVFYSTIAATKGNGAATTYKIGDKDEVECIATDTLAIYAVADVATTLNTTTGYNKIYFRRVGN